MLAHPRMIAVGDGSRRNAKVGHGIRRVLRDDSVELRDATGERRQMERCRPDEEWMRRVALACAHDQLNIVRAPEPRDERREVAWQAARPRSTECRRREPRGRSHGGEDG